MQEILKYLNPSLSTLAQVSKFTEETPIPQGKEPIVVRVEAAPADKKDGAATWRYTLMLPGSAYSKLELKVKEPTPSISQAEIESHNGIKVAVEGFHSSFIEGSDKSTIFYAKAEKIIPITPAPGVMK